MKKETCLYVAGRDTVAENAESKSKQRRNEETGFYVANIEALIEEVEPMPQHSFALAVGSLGAGHSRPVLPAEIVAMMPHFAQYGVRPEHGGAPVMRDAHGCLLYPDETLDHLFGYIGGGSASVVLFMGYGIGAFDDVLISRCGRRPTDKKLFLARLHLALAALTATPAPRAPGRPSAAMVEALQPARRTRAVIEALQAA